MPNEGKKRGRREEKKRKREEENAVLATSERQKSEDIDDVEIIVNGNEVYEGENYGANAGPTEIPFYGLLDEDEQEYFKRADSMLELNQFANAEERSLFLNSVYMEANGKELKIANSQSCSRLLERLIMMSTPSQLKALFQKLSGHFIHLAQHRFASHCCETLFLQCAPIVTQELLGSLEEQQKAATDGEIYVSMENLFLYALNELEDNLGYLMTDPFASHTLRVLLLVLSGRPLADSNTTTLIQSKKKENIAMASHNSTESVLESNSRTVPEAFHAAVERMISGMVAVLDTTYLRALTTHPIGNPVLQLLLELELSSSEKQKAKESGSLFRKLIPEDTSEVDSSASFVNSLMYDTVGSRLVEVIIKFAPGKTFKMLYANIFRDKLGAMAKNDIAGFIVIKVLDRLSKEDLQSAMERINPQIGLLVDRSRTSIIKTLIERCRIRGADVQSVGDELVRAYGTDPVQRLKKMLRLDTSDTGGMADDRKNQMEKQDTGKVHGSLLAQSMLETPGVLRELITDGLLEMDTTTLVLVAKDRAASRMLQCSLAYSDQTVIFRRVLIQRFFGHIADLATDVIGSHVVDEFWAASKGLTFIRERIAAEILENEVLLRESFSGRAIWRNWKMDVFKTKRGEWIFRAKELDGQVKTGIEAARKKFADTSRINKRGARAKKQSGANALAVATVT
ncbi:Nucleolar protein 9 [Pseudocyphellaria aurata]|nr:Nucleolar protein 9 [Pseudocyphellaria aurata]